MKEEEEDEKGGQQAAIRMKHVIMSTIEKSHKSFIADIQFIPGGVRVDKRHPNEGKSWHFISCSEDGLVSIWDTRTVDKEEIKAVEAKGRHGVQWTPLIQVQLLRQEDSVNLGLSRILFDANQTNPTFWGASDEGDLVFVDWSIKPVGGGDGENKLAEYVRT